MRSPRELVKAVARAVLNAVSGGYVGDLVVDVVPGVAHDVWDWWGKNRGDAERKAELEALAQMPPAEMRQQVAEIVVEAAADQPAQVQAQLVSYLTQLPGTLRQSLRRPEDPDGRTVPAGLRLQRAEDLQRLLPARLPRYRPGDRPLPGVDWELVELLGVGGFGEVWKARNPLLDGMPPVALKFCLDSEAQKCLRHEATVLNHVMRHGRHPGIVPLLHAYLTNDPPCLEYEYVEGGDLSGLLRSRPDYDRGLPPKEATALVRRLAGIVGHFHRLDPPIVHRDLKPANILLDCRSTIDDCRLNTGNVRITDFGIGGIVARQALGTTVVTRSRAPTVAGVRDGAYTPLYASPQQVQGEPPDPRDDVHALGVIWYQLLAGDLNAGAPPGFRWAGPLKERGMSGAAVELLASCFEPHPEDRPSDALALAEALDRLETRPVAVTVEPPREEMVSVAEEPASGPLAGLPPLSEPARELQAKYRRMEAAVHGLESNTRELTEALRQQLHEQLEKRPDGTLAEMCALAPTVPRSVLVPYLQHLREVRSLRGQLIPLLEEDLLILLPEFFAATGRPKEFPLEKWVEWEPHLMARYAGWQPAEMQQHAEKGYQSLWAEWFDEQCWRSATGEDTEDAYAAYLADPKNHLFRSEAQREYAEKLARRDAETARKARQADTPAALRDYLAQWPRGRHVAEARTRLEELHDRAWRRAEADSSLEAYEAYLREFPDGSMASRGQEAAADALRLQVLREPLNVEARRRYLTLRCPRHWALDQAHARRKSHWALFWATAAGALLIGALTFLLSGWLLLGARTNSGGNFLDAASPIGALTCAIMTAIICGITFGMDWRRASSNWVGLGPLPSRAYLWPVSWARKKYLKGETPPPFRVVEMPRRASVEVAELSGSSR